jgi:hypothetical protein
LNLKNRRYVAHAIKVTPPGGSASESQAIVKRLKVICGTNTSYLADSEWIATNTPPDICEVRICPKNSVKPNIGASEFGEALDRVLPFVTKDDSRPILRCVLFVAKEGKLTLVGADGYRLATICLDYDEGEGQALIDGGDLKGIASALKRARRARISFEANSSLDTKDLVLDTELIRYRFMSINGSYPDWQKLIPTDFKSFAHFDTIEATRAVNSLKALSNDKAYAIDLDVGGGKIVLASPDDKGQAEMPADTDGEPIKVRLDGDHFGDVLRACGGMVDLKLTTSYSSVLFGTNGYQAVLMPMISPSAAEQAKKDKEAQEAATQTATKTEKAEAVAEAEAITKAVKAKPKKHGKAKEPVAVA